MKIDKASANAQSGNVFFFILLGVVLFAALSYTVSRGLKSEGTGKLTTQKASLAAADILSYAQKLERAVARLRSKSISENDISFETPADAAYAHSPAVTANEEIFSPSGGAISFQKPPQDANDGTDWIFTGETCIQSLGTGGATCETDSSNATEELLAVLTNIDTTVCTEINKRLNITGIPADTGGGASSAKFIGDFTDGTKIILTGGPFDAACFSRSGTNTFYKVLITR